MKYLNEEVKNQLSEILSGMKDEVNILVFTKEEPCETCEETRDFLNEFASVSNKLNLEMLDIKTDALKANDYNVTLTPSIVLLDKERNYKRIKFNGIPTGHEINSFISSLMEVSGNTSELPADISERLSKISKPMNIKVFVTLSCPHCPGAVEKAHKLALENNNIEADMIEAQTFYDLSEEYNVSSVPKIVINDKHEFVGNQSFEVFLSEMEKELV